MLKRCVGENVLLIRKPKSNLLNNSNLKAKVNDLKETRYPKTGF